MARAFFRNNADYDEITGFLLLSGAPTSLVKTGPKRHLLSQSILAILLFSAAALIWLSSQALPPLPGSLPFSATANGADELLGRPEKIDADSGSLVILTRQSTGQLSPAYALENDMLSEFAADMKLQPVWATYRSTDDLFRYLNDFNGDLIIANLDAAGIEFDTPVEYTLPWGISSQQLVTRSGQQTINDSADLAGRRIAIKQSSAAWSDLEVMASTNPAMQIQIIPEQLAVETILARVSAGHYDLAALDNISLEQKLPDFPQLEVVYKLGQENIMAWAVRSANSSLHSALNQFLYKNHLQLEASKSYREDLPALQKRKVLRLITYQGPVNYYLDNGRLRGFEYELLKRFAKSRGMRLGVLIAETHEQMAAMLVQGRGDIATTFVPQTDFTGVNITFTRHYGFSAPVVIGRELDFPLLDSRDLQGRRVVLPAESPYRAELERLRHAGIAFELIEAEPGVNTATTLYRVSQGEYDLTVIGSHQLNAEFAGQLNLRSHFALTEPAPFAWAVRAGATELRSALDEFIELEYRQEFYNTLSAKYIENPVRRKDRELLAQISRLSPYDEIVRKYAEQYGFDWRLIVAQMYQESRFDPVAASTAGATGLMQLTADTAALLNVKDLHDPDSSISGGVKYMAYLRERFDKDLLMEDRTWFTLAAYNAGYGRVQRARRLAAGMGLDKDKWFDNVEQGMLLLSRPYRKDGELIRDCSCGQTAHYIREIRTLYNNYVRLTQAARFALTEPVVAEINEFAGEG